MENWLLIGFIRQRKIYQLLRLIMFEKQILSSLTHSLSSFPNFPCYHTLGVMGTN